MIAHKPDARRWFVADVARRLSRRDSPHQIPLSSKSAVAKKGLKPFPTMSILGHGYSQTTGSAGWFKTTHWSVVLEAGRRDSPGADVALATLYQNYWHPVYCYARRLGRSPEDAKDLSQAFFLRLVEKDYLKDLDRETGKFRSFLLVVLKRFLANEWDRANRQKRGGGCHIVSIDAQDTELRYLAEPVDHRTPDKEFDHRWALAVLERVGNRLNAEMVEEGKAIVFAELRGFVSGDGGGASYSEAATRLQMSEGALRVTVHRLRHRYRELLREEIGSTVDDPAKIDEEIRQLFLSLG